ncbi:MAG: glycosidase [Candidatus Sumerlaeia bacterium]
MALEIKRCAENPIVWPGKYWWRMATVFNPAVMYDEGKFYMYERAAGQLRPFHCYIGLLESEDGVHFEHVSDEPVFTPEMAGCKYGSVQDPRIVRIEDKYYMTYAYRPYAWGSNPTGVGVPESYQMEYPGFSGKDEDNQTRSGIAVSKDRVHWQHLAWVTATDIDDRNVILFPEKIGGKFAALRRPSGFVSTGARHEAHPCIRISYSDDMQKWSEPEVVIRPEFKWEDNRVGGSTPPIRTEHGWLALYHAVENQDEKTRRVCYRMGAMMLDINDPTKVIARCPQFIMEPTEYYEKHGLYIPNVIFPTAAVVKDGVVHIYYGACDTAIGLATVGLDELVAHVMQYA